MTTPRMLAPKSVAPRSQTRRYRKPETTAYFHHIDGMRGLAISLVVFFHVFVGKVSSGVDVFLLIGGILFVSSQTKNALNPQGLSFTQSVVRMFRRLYPSLITVVVVGMCAMMVVAPPAQWDDVFRHGSAAVLYNINNTFIAEGSSYARAGADASVFQHLWSMSAQLQIYLVLLVIITVIASVFKTQPRRATVVINSVVAITTGASLAYAIYLHNVDQVHNYYSTFSRFWEIGLGSLIGVYALQNVVLAPALRWVATVVGTTLIVTTGLFLDGANQFPGIATLIPLVGAIMVVLSGKTSPLEKKTRWNRGLVPFYESRPMVWLGSMSYNFYLWHWVVLIVSGYIVDLPAYHPARGIPVIILSLGLAWVAHRYVEVPCRQKTKPQRMTARDMVSGRWYSAQRRRTGTPTWQVVAATSFIALFVVSATSPLVYGVVQWTKMSEQEKKIEQLGGMNVAYPGARSLLASQEAPEGVDVLPSPSQKVETMMPDTQGNKCFTGFESTDIVTTDENGNPCQYGDVDSKETMYIVGGSHSEMYLPALDAIGKKRGIKMIPIVKMGCGLYQDEKWDKTPYPECREYSDKVMDYVISNPPTKGVFHTSTRPRSITGGGGEFVPGYYVDAMRRLSEKNIPLYLMRDIPWGLQDNREDAKDVRMCVSRVSSEHGDVDQECGHDATWSLADTDPAKNAYRGMKNVVLMDINNSIVSDGWVHPVVGNILVYRDGHHLTDKFAATLTDEIDRQMFVSPIKA